MQSAGFYKTESGMLWGCKGFDGDCREYGKRAADPDRVKTGNLKSTDNDNLVLAAA